MAQERTATTAWVTVKRGLSLSPELRRGLGITLGLAALATAGRVIVPIAVQQVIDSGIVQDDVDMPRVIRMILFALVAVAVTAAATGIMHLRLAKVTETALSGLRVRAFRHIHDLSMLHQASEHRGVLVSRVTSDVDQVSRFMQWGGIMLVVFGGQAVLALVVMAVYSLPLAGVVVLFLPFITGAMRWFQKRLDKAYLLVRERVGRMLAVLAEVVVGAPVIRAYGIEERTRRRLGESIESHRVAAVTAGRLSAWFSGVGEQMSSIVVTAVLIVGTILAVNGHESPGTVVAFLFLVQLFIQPVQMLGEVINEAQTAVAGWRRVLDVLDIPPDVADPGPSGIDLRHEPLSVRFVDVSFRYPRSGEVASDASGHLALDTIDVTIEPESRIAVVGETGSGKTTFAKLLTRLMDPSEGLVLLGGIDARKIRFASLRDRVVMVPQEGMLFRGTILDNVLMGRVDADEAAALATFETMGLTDWLNELPLAIRTQVGERGASLSVGERQLVTLVRAAMADPDLLVLDEATSAVDPSTEVRINRALATLTEGRTVVTIAHRLSTAEAADRVLVFDEGTLAQDGSHADLVHEGGIYGRLFESWQRGVNA
jgi:putative ABC transport system ATP-binding protein